MNNIVLDNGSSLLKAGISGTDIAPSIFCPTLIGVLVNQTQQDMPIPALLGLDAIKQASHYSLRYPVQRGMIIDFDDCVELWRYVLQLAIDDKRPDSLFITQPALNPKKNRQLSLQYAFEMLQTSKFYLSSSPGLVLYANGKSTGSVVEIGDGITNIAAIAQGYIGPNSMVVNQIAGRQITEYLGELIFQKHRLAFVSSIEKEIVRQMKEKHAYLKSFDQANSFEEKKFSPKSKKDKFDGKCLTYYLPDNQQIKISESIFSQASQALFHPLETLQRDIQSIPQALGQIISQSDINLQRKLNQNIYLAGGTSLMRGLTQRFYNQYSAIMKNNKYIEVNASQTRNISSWMGGAIVSQLSSFQPQWVTIQEYKQYGANIVHSKCAI